MASICIFLDKFQKFATENDALSASLFVKLTNLHQFLHHTSCHCKKEYSRVPNKWRGRGGSNSVFFGGGGGGVRDEENF